MKNHKVIIVNGMQRGGTNIVWNLLQSHPDVVSPIKETGELIYPKLTAGRASRILRKPMKLMIGKKFGPIMKHIDNIFFTHKICTVDNPDNKFKNENEIYTLD
ncbi:MAG: hypothetical protein ACOCPU_02870 [Methanohalophilus sp.]